MKKDIKTDIMKLESYQATWRQKCRRNLSLYEFSRNIDLQSQNDNNTVGYYTSNDTSPESDHTSMIQENVIRSCIDTLASKIASQKVTPFFNTVNGTFKELQIVKAAQQFFDILYEELNMNKTVVSAFVDSCITDRGIIYIDRDNKNIERVQPWQFFFDPREYAYGNLTHCSVKKTDYPTTLLNIKTDLDTVTLHTYWDIKSHTKTTWIEELNKVTTEEWPCDCLPFVILRWSNPIKASSASSVVDLLYGIQRQINYILLQIRDASQSAFGNKYLVPSDSNVRVERLTNRNGEIIEYDPQMSNNGAIPVQIVTSPFMDSQWFTALQQFKQDAYEMVGISQLSASSQKPQGLNSGIGLQTLENIEGDRFETQLNTVIRAYVDVAKVALQIFPENEDILPNNRYRGHITWKDIKNAQNLMSIQFSSMDKISKDPETKQKIITQWIAAGWISTAHGAQLMEIPDDNRGYSLINNSINAVMTVIDNCIENDVYDVPIFIDDELLKEEITNTCLSLTAANNPLNKIDIQKLLKLYDVVVTRNKNAMTNAEYAAVMSLQEELNGAMPQIEATAQSFASGISNELAQQDAAAQQTQQTQQPEVTSDENEKTSWSNDLYSLAKKYYKEKKECGVQ